MGFHTVWILFAMVPAPPVTQLGREAGNALTFNLDHSVVADQEHKL